LPARPVGFDVSVQVFRRLNCSSTWAEHGQTGPAVPWRAETTVAQGSEHGWPAVFTSLRDRSELFLRVCLLAEPERYAWRYILVAALLTHR
jgi:hypothetical protein